MTTDAYFRTMYTQINWNTEDEQQLVLNGVLPDDFNHEVYLKESSRLLAAQNSRRQMFQ